MNDSTSGELVIAIASDPSAPSHVCASHLGSPTNFLRSAIACTLDRGTTRRSFEEGFGAAGFRALVFDQRSPTTTYAGSRSGLFRSSRNRLSSSRDVASGGLTPLH